MALEIQRLNFDPVTGDNPSEAFLKLDNNMGEIADAVGDLGNNPASIGTRLANAENVIGGLGNASTRNVGTGAGTVAAGDDIRITGAASKAYADATFLAKTGGNVTGSLTVSGALASAQNVGSTTAILVLYATGANGQILLRPQGAGSAVGQCIINASGIFSTPAGFGTAQGSNSFKIGWTGNAEFYVDGTKIGNFAFATSDPRLKRDIEYVDSEADGDADIAKLLRMKPVTWYQKAVGIFGDDGIQRRSFLSPEMQDIDPILAPGDRDGVTETGGVEPLNLNNDAILSVVVGALRREVQLRKALEERVAALEAGSQS